MTQEILVNYGMIECHLMADHEACYFTGSQNYATLNEEWIYSSWKYKFAITISAVLPWQKARRIFLCPVYT